MAESTTNITITCDTTQVDSALKKSEEQARASASYVTSLIEKAAGSISGLLVSAFSDLTSSLEGELGQMHTALDGLKSAFYDTFLEDALRSGIEALTGAIQFCTENLDWLGPIAVTAATAIGELAVAFAALKIIENASAALGKFGEDLAKCSFALPFIAVSVLITGIIALSSVLKKNSEDAGNTTRSYKELNTELKEIKRRYDEAADSAGTEYDETKAYIDLLSDLVGVEKKSAQQKETVKVLVDKLNNSISGLGLEYDEATDSINMTTDALYDAAAAQKASAETDAGIQLLIDAQKNYNDTLAACEAAEQRVNEQRKVSEQIQSTLNDTMGQAAQGAQGVTAGLESAELELENYQAALANAKEELDAANLAVYGFSDGLAATLTPQEEAGVMAEDLVDRLSAMQETYDAAYESAYESLHGQYSVWQEVEQQAAMSTDSIMAAIQSQIDAWTNYNENVENIRSRDIEGLDAFLAANDDGSEEFRRMIAGMADASDEEIQQIIDAYNNGLIPAQQRAAENTADYTTGTTAAIDAMSAQAVSELRAMAGELDGAAADNVNALADAMESGEIGILDAAATLATAAADGWDSTDWKTVGENSTAGLNSGLENGRSSIIDKITSLASTASNAFKRFLGINSPSRVFRRFGECIDEGLGLGIEDMAQQPLAAIQQMALHLKAEGAALSADLFGEETVTGSVTLPDLAAIERGVNLAATTSHAIEIKNILTGSVEMDGYTVGTIVLRNLDDAAAYTLRGV